MLKMNLPENYMVHAALASTYAQLGEMDRAKAALDHGERIHVVQAKTAAKLRIPVHMELRKALDAHARVSPIILTTARGKPFTGSYFRHHWRKAMAAAGLEGLVFHGLRYTAAAKLAEAGCSLKEIAAITGHKSLAMLEKYSRGADQEKLAGAAIFRLENAARTKIGKLRS